MDGTTVSIDGTDDSNLTVTGSGKDLDIAVAGGSTQELRLASAGTGASALHLNASAGSVDIDSADNITMDAADDIALTTTSADGLITLHSAHTAGQAILIDANAAAGSILDVDAGIMVQSGSVDLSGSAFYHDKSDQRWSVGKSLASNRTAATSPTQFVTTVKTDSVNPSSESGSYGAGEMHVNTSTGEIWVRFG